MALVIEMNRPKRLFDQEDAYPLLYRSSCRMSMERGAQYSRHSNQARGGHRQFEVLVDRLDGSANGLSDASDRLTSAEALLNALVFDLAKPTFIVLHCSARDGAAPSPGIVVRHMRRHVPVALLGGVARVVGSGGAACARPVCRVRVERRRRRSLAESICVRDHRAHRPLPVALDQHMALEGRNGCGVLALVVLPCVRIRCAHVRVFMHRVPFEFGWAFRPGPLGPSSSPPSFGLMLFWLTHA